MVTKTEVPTPATGALEEPVPTEQVSAETQPPESESGQGAETGEVLEVIKKVGIDAALSLFSPEEIAQATAVKDVVGRDRQRTVEKAKQTLAIQRQAEDTRKERRTKITELEGQIRENTDGHDLSKEIRTLRELERTDHREETQLALASAIEGNPYFQRLDPAKVDGINRLLGDMEAWTDTAVNELTNAAFEAGVSKGRETAMESQKNKEKLAEAYYRRKFEQDLLVLSGQVPPRTGRGTVEPSGSDQERLDRLSAGTATDADRQWWRGRYGKQVI